MHMFKLKIMKSILALASVFGLAGVIGLGVTSGASAGNVDVALYLGNGAGIHYTGNRHHRQIGYNYGQRRHYRQRHRRNDYYRHQPRRTVCGPRRAVNKAYRRGLHNPHVHRINHRRIVVRGYRHGYRTRMVFDRHSNCHLIRIVGF